ncbi:MAG: transcriptional repressor [Polyangiaceae bacterium]|nr:transcriptional repressor [Polyangiaceae bacterium]
MSAHFADALRSHGIQPSAQRVAVAEYLLETTEHPSAEEVWARVRAKFPMISRATVYNTVNLFVEKGLVKPLILTEGRVVFDPDTRPHHHFVDDETGIIHDVPWEALKVSGTDRLEGFELREYAVVLHGRAVGAARCAG